MFWQEEFLLELLSFHQIKIYLIFYTLGSLGGFWWMLLDSFRCWLVTISVWRETYFNIRDDSETLVLLVLCFISTSGFATRTRISFLQSRASRRKREWRFQQFLRECLKMFSQGHDKIRLILTNKFENENSHQPLISILD